MRAAFVLSFFLVGACFTILPAAIIFAPATASAQHVGDGSDLDAKIDSKFNRVNGLIRKGVLSLAVAIVSFIGSKFMMGDKSAWHHLGMAILGILIVALAYELVQWAQN